MNTDKVIEKVKQSRGYHKAEQALRDYDAQGVLEGKREELADLAQKNYGLVKEKAQEIVNNLSQKTDMAKEKVENHLTDYNSKLEEAADKLPGDVKQTVTRYPWVMIVAVLTLGLAAGMWLKPCFKKYEYKYKYYQE